MSVKKFRANTYKIYLTCYCCYNAVATIFLTIQAATVIKGIGAKAISYETTKFNFGGHRAAVQFRFLQLAFSFE